MISQFRRRNTSSFERIIRDTPSFKAILVLAAELESGDGGARSSSSSAIADYFMRQKQKAAESGLLLQQQQLEEHMSTQKAMEILWFSSHYSWEAARICGSLFRSILDSVVYMRHVRDILDDRAGRSVAGDRMRKLGNPENLLSKAIVDQILHVKDLWTELDGKLKKHRKRLRVRFLAKTGALECTAKAGVSKCTAGMKSTMRSGYAANGSDDDDQEEALTAVTCEHTVEEPAWIRWLGLVPLHKLNVQLQELEMKMYAVHNTLDTLMCQVNRTQIYLDNTLLTTGLRDESLSEHIAERITERHRSLGDHLEDLKELVLKCFCFINNARDLIYPPLP